MRKMIRYERVEATGKDYGNALAGFSVFLTVAAVSTVALGIASPTDAGITTTANSFAWVGYILFLADRREEEALTTFFASGSLLLVGLGTLLLGGATYVPSRALSVILISSGALLLLIFTSALGFVTSIAIDRNKMGIRDKIIPLPIRSAVKQASRAGNEAYKQKSDE
jgi:hypothetical protein